MNELRRLRRTAGLLQKELAGLVGVPINTFRMWDSGLRAVPADVLARVRHAIRQPIAIGRLPPEGEREQKLGSTERRLESGTETFLQSVPALMGKKVSDPSTLSEDAHADVMLPLHVLATVVGVHPRTLQAAARDGRLPVVYDTRTTFRQLRARATIVDAWEFRRVSYGKRRHFPQRSAPFTLSDIPPDYDQRVRAMRKHLRISQAAYAALVGAAGKAVVYQWESRKRCPSRLFWSRIEALVDNPHLPQLYRRRQTLPPEGSFNVEDRCRGLETNPMINKR